jgi:hypothetical protein
MRDLRKKVKEERWLIEAVRREKLRLSWLLLMLLKTKVKQKRLHLLRVDLIQLNLKCLRMRVEKKKRNLLTKKRMKVQDWCLKM